jgi:hypothetical protein
MAFKISKKPSWTAPVTVETPNTKGGHDLSKFYAEFKRVTNDEIDELRKLPQREVQEAVLVGWSEFLDDDNNPVDFNNDTLVVLLNIPEALYGLTQAFWGNVVKAKEKN